MRRIGGWRYGFGSGYEAEQTSFALKLWPRIRRDFDILHVQDPWVALLLDKLHRIGLSRPHVILAHGTEEPVKTLKKYSNLQHLAPCYVEDWNRHRPARQKVFAVGNFVDIDVFKPADKAAGKSTDTKSVSPPAASKPD